MGPTSFALDSNGAVVLQQPSQSASGPQITLSGGGAVRAPQGQASYAPGGQFAEAAQQLASFNAKTLDAIDKLTEGALQPLIVQKQREAYFEGMSRVAQGESLLEIEKEQPWYSKIFGPSATVQGAQAMTAMTAVTQAQTEFLNAMPQLREQSPDAVRQYLVEQAARVSNTGDPATDALVQAKIAEQWGPMLKTHMQNHIQWQQEQTAKTWTNMVMSQGNLLQAYLHNQNDKLDPQAAQLEVKKYVDMLQKPPGMEDESYGKLLASLAQGQLSQGNFEAYTVMKGTPDIWNALPIQTRTSLENQEELWTQRQLKFNPAFTGMLTNVSQLSVVLSNGAYQGSEETLNRQIDSMNSKWQEATGSNTLMIDNFQRDNLIKQFYAGQQRMQGIYAKAASDLANDQAQRTAVSAAFTNGNTSLLPPNVSDGIARDEMEQAWSSILSKTQNDPTALDNGIKLLAAVSGESKLRVRSLEDQLRNDAIAFIETGGNITERQRSSLQVMQKLLSTPQSVHALASYVGDDVAGKMVQFINLGPDLDDPKALEFARSLVKNGGKEVASADERKSAKSFIAGQDDNWFMQIMNILPGTTPGMLNDYALTGETKQWMAEELAAPMAQARKAFPSLNNEQAAQLAFRMHFGDPNSGDFIDGTFVRSNRKLSDGSQSLYQAFSGLIAGGKEPPPPQASESYQYAVREAAHESLRSAVEAGVAKYNAANPDKVQAVASRFDPNDYQAIGGEQMQGGNLMMFYLNRKTDQFLSVLVKPQAVKDKYLESLNRSPLAPVGVLLRPLR